MGNHEYCAECGENDFHFGEPCDPEAKAKFQRELRRLKERKEKADSHARIFMKHLSMRYGLDSTFDGDYVKIHFWEFEDLRRKS